MGIIKDIHTPSAHIMILEEGIMHVHVLTKNYFEMENSREIVEARTKLADGIAYPVLFTSEHPFVTPSQEVKSFVTSEERTQLVKADAFIMKSFPQRLAAKLYVKFNKPAVPTAFFSNEDEAKNWLKTFVD